MAQINWESYFVGLKNIYYAGVIYILYVVYIHIYYEINAYNIQYQHQIKQLLKKKKKIKLNKKLTRAKINCVHSHALIYKNIQKLLHARNSDFPQ